MQSSAVLLLFALASLQLVAYAELKYVYFHSSELSRLFSETWDAIFFRFLPATSKTLAFWAVD